MTSTPAHEAGHPAHEAGRSSYDARLIQAVAAGDTRALRELMTRNSPWLQARLLNRRITPHIVDDVLQETFIAVHHGARTFRDTNARGWLWTITQRKLIDQLRCRGRQDALTRREKERSWHERPLVAPSAEDTALGSTLTGTSVGDALAMLSPEARQVLTLRYIDGFSVRETAVRLGVSEGTVKSRASRGCEELRVRLGVLDGARESGGDDAEPIPGLGR
ncbi:RNA polymerase sigma factor [Streptomyces sp. NPDC059002]|uniref:RNA polymerase sigma factor n=1 Tax=Streptomyces sp. NPDC059002 TaxID=3346690 RepID=UPI0036C8D521